MQAERIYPMLFYTLCMDTEALNNLTTMKICMDKGCEAAEATVQNPMHM